MPPCSEHALSCLLQSICSARDPAGGRLHGDSTTQDPAPDGGRATLRENESESQSTREREWCVRNEIIAARSVLSISWCWCPAITHSALGHPQPTPISACSLPFVGLVTLQVPAPRPPFHPVLHPVTDPHLPYVITTELATHLTARLYSRWLTKHARWLVSSKTRK